MENIDEINMQNYRDVSNALITKVKEVMHTKDPEIKKVAIMCVEI
jgi:hypothetical protein